MECERLIKLVKTWYLQVKDEALAPARMIAFMQKHVSECPVCLVDDGVQQEVDRIARIVLPPSKALKPKPSPDDDEDEPEEEEQDTEEESTDDDDEESDDAEDSDTDDESLDDDFVEDED